MKKLGAKLKVSTVSFFIAGVTLVLIAIAFVFPRNGLKIFGKEFNFLTAEQVLESGLEETINPDALVASSLDSLDKQMKALKDLKSDSASNIALEIANNDTNRLVFPDDNRDALDAFFESLYSTQQTKEQVRILHYGDSQIEEDRITSFLRKELQARFGGGGLGMVSARPISGTMSASHAYSNNWTRYTAFSLTGQPLDSKRYGSMGITCKYHGNIAAQSMPKYTLDSTNNQEKKKDSVKVSIKKDSLAAKKNQKDTLKNAEPAVFMDKNKGYLTLQPYLNTNSNLGKYDQLRVFLGAVQEPIKLNVSSTLGNFQEAIAAGTDYQVLTFNFEQAPKSVSVTFSGGISPEIYGVSLESKGGVVMDNIAMRGSDGSVFVKFQAAIAKAMFQDLNPRLIILQFGGNVMPVISGEKSAQGYGRQMAASIKTLRRYCPNASFLFVGPSDMSKKVNGQLQTYPYMETVIKALKETCKENNVAYFDMYKAMGGKNSMIQWVNKGLAAKDYIHFNRSGANKMAEILYQYLMLEYELFLLRTGKTEKENA